MIISGQIKAARALLGWTAQDLANQSKVGVATVRRYEMSPTVPKAHLDKLLKIKAALETAGIDFTGNPEVNPGVVLHLKPPE